MLHPSTRKDIEKSKRSPATQSAPCPHMHVQRHPPQQGIHTNMQAPTQMCTHMNGPGHTQSSIAGHAETLRYASDIHAQRYQHHCIHFQAMMSPFLLIQVVLKTTQRHTHGLPPHTPTQMRHLAKTYFVLNFVKNHTCRQDQNAELSPNIFTA